QRRDRGQQRGVDRLAGDEHVGRLEPGGERSVDEILALADEQAELRPRAPALQPAHQLQARVRSRGDPLAASADFACSPIRPNAAGSVTARSASTCRSSSISALRQPATNWLYESPCWRAAALMRMIQRLRIVRFRFLRSR